jgi:uncharacterized lipoprotein YajG
MKTVIVATAALLLAACATPTPTTDQPVAEQKTYRVGSHLPVRDKDSGSSTSTVNTAPPPFQPPSGYVPPKNMGGG